MTPRRRLRRGLKRLLARWGIHVSRERQSGWDPSNLRTICATPRTIFDVGVGHGTPSLYEAFPDSYYVLVEPIDEFKQSISKWLDLLNGEHVMVAIGSQNGSAVLSYDPKFQQRTSILPRSDLTRTGSELSTRCVELRTLDVLGEQRDLQEPFLIKLDVEGFELEALKGAEEVLRRTQWLIIECSVASRFEAGYNFADLIRFTSDRGFRLKDILHAERRPNVGTVLIDALFEKSAS